MIKTIKGFADWRFWGILLSFGVVIAILLYGQHIQKWRPRAEINPPIKLEWTDYPLLNRNIA